MTEVKEKLNNGGHSELDSESHKGYKKTKLGWIPEDWSVVKLKNIAIINQESLTESTNPEYQFQYIDLSSVNLGKIDFSCPKILFKNAPSRARRLLKNYDIIFSTVRPYLKGFALANFETKDIVCSTGFAIITVANKNDIKFIYQTLFSNIMLQQFNQLLIGSNYPALNSSAVENLLFPYTKDNNEKQKIAEILTTWDDGIEVLEKLIEKKQTAKKALMQKIYGKNSKIKKNIYKLGHLFTNRKENNYCDLELLSVCDGIGIVPHSSLNKKDNSNEDKSKYLRVCIGDIAYNTMRMWQGRCGVSDYEGIVSPAYTICIPNDNIDVRYMYYMFKTPHMIHDFWRYSQGIVEDTLNLKYNNFEVIKVQIPEKNIQIKIANILNTYDEEMKILNSKLEKLKEQKKGLMQKLLTGQIRVKV